MPSPRNDKRPHAFPRGRVPEGTWRTSSESWSGTPRGILRWPCSALPQTRETATNDSAHQQNGNEYRYQRGAHGKHGEGDFPGAAKRSLDRPHAGFEIAGDVL